MEWVIPTDQTPGAGSDACVQHLEDLVESIGALEQYTTHLPALTEQDLANPIHPFAPMFINHVRDVYYGYADCGAWEDMGYVVTG